MSNYAAPIEVVQAALHRLGEETITSLTDGSAAALVATSNYEGIVRAALTKHAWSFATSITALTLQETITLGPWTKAYTFADPAVINLRYVMDAGRRLRAREADADDGAEADGDEEAPPHPAPPRSLGARRTKQAPAFRDRSLR